MFYRSIVKNKSKILAAVIAVIALTVLAGSLTKLTSPRRVNAEAKNGYYMSYSDFMSGEGYTKRPAWTVISREIGKLLDGGLALYERGEGAKNDDGYTAYQCVSRAYGYWYETSGFERTVLAQISSARVTQVELQYGTCKKLMRDTPTSENIERARLEITKLKNYLNEDALKLNEIFGITDESQGGGELSAWATFIACFGILFREGLEAILIVGAMVAYLVKTGNKEKTKAVYIGSALAIGASFLTAWLLSLLNLTGIPQEIIEGVTALIAVAVLVYVSNWMISKAESEAWTKYIKGKVSTTVGAGRTWALGATAFLAVFREGAEVILFYQPFVQDGTGFALWGGIIAGFAAIAIVFVLLRVFSVKLPLKPFFLATSILMAVMSVAFLGSGIQELFIDGGLMPVASISGLAFMSSSEILTFLGVYPTWITLLPQLILTGVWVVTFVLQLSPLYRREEVSAEGKLVKKGFVTNIIVITLSAILFIAGLIAIADEPAVIIEGAIDPMLTFAAIAIPIALVIMAAAITSLVLAKSAVKNFDTLTNTSSAVRKLKIAGMLLSPAYLKCAKALSAETAYQTSPLFAPKTAKDSEDKTKDPNNASETQNA